MLAHRESSDCGDHQYSTGTSNSCENLKQNRLNDKKTTNKSGLDLGQNFGENPFSNHWVKFLPVFEAEQQVL